MKLEVERETLLRLLQQVVGAVERRQTMPALANVLIRARDDALALTATDLEIELRASVDLAPGEPGETTVNARKLLDICRNLPSSAAVRLELDEDRLRVRSGRSRFTLATLPANEFPVIDEIEPQVEFRLGQAALKQAIDRVGFAMAQQDVRFYLNGLLFELAGDRLRTVATDGHRLSMTETAVSLPEDTERQAILPRKGVLELARQLDPQAEDEVTLRLSGNHVQAEWPGIRFTSKLIDGRFPDYTQVMPQGGDNELRADRETLRQALARTAILSNEKYKGVRFALDGDGLRVQTHNPDQEEAEEEVEVEYRGEAISIGFNVVYLLDVLANLAGDSVRVRLTDANSSCLITDPQGEDSRHVVMPMRL